MFSPLKTAQMLAFFAAKDNRVINVMKAVKLMYMADRESLRRYGEPISYDYMVSMNNGPVLSQTLNLINGDVPESVAAVWDAWISDRANHKVALQRTIARADLDRLSDSDIEILEHVWDEFGAMSQWKLSEYTHANCPEWKHPGGSSSPIDENALLQILGWEPDAAAANAQSIKTERELDKLLASL